MTTTQTSERQRVSSPYLLALRDALHAAGHALTRFRIGHLDVELRETHDSLFAVVRRSGFGGLAVRVVFLAAPFKCKVLTSEPGEEARLIVTSSIGEHLVAFAAVHEPLEQLRITVRLTPVSAIALPFAPRDIYPLDAHDNPLGAAGNVEAAQRGLNTGVVYFRIDDPAFGNILYFQNLTALNDYYRYTGTKPDGAVGGEWPELGYLLPTPERDADPASSALKPGVQTTLSDAILIFRHHAPPDEQASARQFLQMLGAAYKMLDLPPVEFRDWVDRAERTARDLSEAPEATVRHYGHLYVHPYTAAEYPDIMVQMSIIQALHEWGKWRVSRSRSRRS